MRLKIIIGSLCAFIAMNLLIGWILPTSDPYLDTDLFVWQQKRRTFESGLSSDTLILGDSQAMSGILPEALTPFGFKAQNLAVPSQQPEGLEYTVKQISRFAPATRRVILNVSPFTLFKSEVWPAFLNYYRETYDLSPFDFEPARIPLAGKNSGDAIYRGFRLLPIFKLRDRFASIIADASPLKLAGKRSERNLQVKTILDAHNGYWVWQSEDSFKCAGTLPAIPALASLKYQDRPESLESYQRVITALKDQGIEVILVFIPLSDVWAGLAASGTELRVYQAMQRLESQGIKTIKMPSRSEYAGLFHDWTHLNYCGAKKYSAWLGDKISKEAFHPPTEADH
ncbi:MAG: hypothetical protein K8S54_06785 [Spirochaetia bacterium]|nr:hypothetical protein [Spirochaetia bacterium]